MTLQQWSENRWLVEHVTSQAEIADLLAVVERDLADAAIEGLSADRRLGIAYNAALQLATAALAAAGYRPGRERAHERAILSLRHTIGLEQGTVDLLDAVRRKRNLSNYERAGTTSASEADEVYAVAVVLNEAVRQWLLLHHPQLLAPS
jgi:hypothetical protein